MRRNKKVFGRKPVGVTYWYARKRKGKEIVTVTYTVQDFTGQRFSRTHAQRPQEVFHVNVEDN